MDPMRQQFATQDSWTEMDPMHAGGQGGELPREGSQSQDDRMERQRLLTQTVEDQVIPRLLIRRREANAARSLVRADKLPERLVRQPTQADMLELTDLVLLPDQDAAGDFVAALQQQGMGTDMLYLDLLSPVARHLGTLWEDDVLHFSEVTLGLVRLQHVMRQFAPTLPGAQPAGQQRPNALLVQVPGEQHSFGLAMVVAFFRNSGWGVWTGHLAGGAELTRMVADQWFGIVGLSSARGDDLEPVAKSIRRIRKASRNPDVAVLVGGPAFMQDPTLAAQVGADGTAIDGRQAVLKAESLLAIRAGRG